VAYELRTLIKKLNRRLTTLHSGQITLLQQVTLYQRYISDSDFAISTGLEQGTRRFQDECRVVRLRICVEEGKLGDILEEWGWIVGDVERKIVGTRKKMREEKVEERKREMRREIDDLHKLRRAIGRAKWFAERLVKKCLFLRVLLVSMESVRKRAVMVERERRVIDEERRAEWMAFWQDRYAEGRRFRRGSDVSEEDEEEDLRNRRCVMRHSRAQY
jgi:hypothetical protein